MGDKLDIAKTLLYERAFLEEPLEEEELSEEEEIEQYLSDFNTY